MMDENPALPGETVAKRVSLSGRKSTGVNPSNLRNWLAPAYFEKLRRNCEVDPSMLNIKGKHKGGRGNKKSGWERSWGKGCGPWFPELEALLDTTITEHRKKRVKVTGKDAKEWMHSLVAAAAWADKEAGMEDDPRKVNWMSSGKWLTGFLKRKGWAYRRATNKRSHSPEDLIGDVLGYTRFLRDLRRDHPSSEDPIWGIFGPRNSFNADSVPVSFASTCKLTLEKKGAKRVSMIVPGSGLDKRQASLQIALHGAKGKQGYPTIILSGACTEDGKADTKKRAAEMEKYKKFKVHVLWQKKAWLGGDTAVQWVECFAGSVFCVCCACCLCIIVGLLFLRLFFCFTHARTYTRTRTYPHMHTCTHEQ
jgi:hypothetical protein